MYVVRQVDKALIGLVRYGTKLQYLTGNVIVILKNPQRGRQVTVYLPQIVRDRIAIGQSYKKIREEVGNPQHADYHYLHQREWCDVSEICTYILNKEKV